MPKTPVATASPLPSPSTARSPPKRWTDVCSCSIAKTDSVEPRFQVRAGVQAIQVFGTDVEAMAPGDTATFDADVFGYPIESLASLEPGEYAVQALLNRYETFNLSTGHTVKLPPDRGEGQQWNRKPGNLYSTPQMIELDPSEQRANHDHARSRNPADPQARRHRLTSSTSRSRARC